MTGFGRAEGEWRGARATVEVRSLNHRFLELRVRLPRDLAVLEQSAVEYVRSRLARGRVDLQVTVSGTPEGAALPTLNLPVARRYISFLKQLTEEMGLSKETDPALILNMRDVILFEEGGRDTEADWEALKPIVEKAIRDLLEAGHAEGERLAVDLKQRIERLGQLSAEMKGSQSDNLNAYRDRLGERIKDLMTKPDVDPNRLAQEVVYYAERCDCTEEMVRFQAHRERFIDLLDRGGAMGRTLDFLVQEMGREINTAASKALSAAVSHAAVEAKSELEKIREQIQNLE